MKDTQGALRHAGIKTTADVYVQDITESVRAAMNSRTRAVLAKGRETVTEAESATSPNRKRWLLQAIEKNGSSDRIPTYSLRLNSRVAPDGVHVFSTT